MPGNFPSLPSVAGLKACRELLFCQTPFYLAQRQWPIRTKLRIPKRRHVVSERVGEGHEQTVMRNVRELQRLAHLEAEPAADEDEGDVVVRVVVALAELVGPDNRRVVEQGAVAAGLDNTTIIWTNELGKGNSHSHNDIPFVVLGGGLGFQTGRALEFDKIAHNRLWLSIAHAFGHRIEAFGSRDHSQGGPLVMG